MHFGERIRLDKCPRKHEIEARLQSDDCCFKGRLWRTVKDKIVQMTKKYEKDAKKLFD